MIKLIVSDFDGTLCPYGSAGVPRGVRERISSLLERGTVFAVSSGRTYGELIRYLPELANSAYFICCDGAYYIKNGRLLYGRHIALEDLKLLAGVSGASFVFHGAETNYGLGTLPDEAARFNCVPISRIGEIGERIFKVTSYGCKLRLPPYCGLRMHWDGGENDGAQYVNRFCDKGAALSDLQMRLMLTKFDTACLGDSGNDIAMMHNATLSFCVGSHSPALEGICTVSVDSAEQALTAILATQDK